MNSSLFAFLLAELLVVSYIDVRTKKISNLWSISHIVIFLGIMAYTQEYPSGSHFIFPVGMIVAGFVLFVFHIMGAGDSKYIASIFLLTPTPLHMLFMEKLLTVTILVGTLLIMLKYFKNAAKIKAYLMTLDRKSVV